MLFDRFLARLGLHSGKNNHEKGLQDKHEKASSKDSPLLQFSNHLNTAKELDAALEEIEKRIQAKSATNKQLLLKAEILIRKGKFRKSRELLVRISKDKKDGNLAESAKYLLKISPQLQQERRNKKLAKLINDLHETAGKYEFELKKLPSIDALPPDFDITLLIRRECATARSAELPKLSLELINRTLQDEQESLWLIHDKALSLNMMGQKQTALQTLRELQKSTNKEKITNSINKNIADINKNQKHYQSKLNFYLAKQLRSIFAASNFDATFLPEDKKINAQTKIKSLAFRKARAILTENPKGCLQITSSILDYYQSDLAALLLKGEALASLNKSDKAIHIWKRLAICQEQNIAQKASELISHLLTEKALKISTKGASKKALSFFIEQNVKHGIAPVLNKDIKTILQKLEPLNTKLSDPELEQHQIELIFNTHVIECLEARFRERNRPNTASPAQKPGAISKTASKAG